MRTWLQHFCDAVITNFIKPEYMPGAPPDAKRLADVRAQFVSRRGFPNVATACDGSHVPFNPDRTYNKNDFRNYKDWYSLLVVAFVDSFHLCIDADIGYAGRSGDNTVLKLSWLMKQIQNDPKAWLGEHGNPYLHPEGMEDCSYDFFHSSTCFNVVEEVFGLWKNRFRFLLRATYNRHKLTSLLIYTTTILHNMCTICKGNEVKGFEPSHFSSANWDKY
eukprot:5984476-Pleurochrysis_carterae.AAC.1